MKSEVSSTAKYTCTLEIRVNYCIHFTHIGPLLYEAYTLCHQGGFIIDLPGRSLQQSKSHIQKEADIFFPTKLWSPFWSPLSIEPIVKPFFLTVKLLMVTYVWNVNFGLMHRVAQNVHFHKSSNIELCEMPNREVSVWTLAPNKSNIGDFTSRVILSGNFSFIKLFWYLNILTLRTI